MFVASRARSRHKSSLIFSIAPWKFMPVRSASGMRGRELGAERGEHSEGRREVATYRCDRHEIRPGRDSDDPVTAYAWRRRRQIGNEAGSSQSTEPFGTDALDREPGSLRTNRTNGEQLPATAPLAPERYWLFEFFFILLDGSRTWLFFGTIALSRSWNCYCKSQRSPSPRIVPV